MIDADLPALIVAHAGHLRLAAVTHLLRPPTSAPAERPSRIVALAGCHHASRQAGTPFVFGWCRPQGDGPVTVLTTSPVTGAGLVYPPAARGHLLDPQHVAALLSATPHWARLNLHHDHLVTPDSQQASAPLDETLLDAWTQPFTWLVYATPVPDDRLKEQAAHTAETERDARSRANSPAYDITADRARARHRELRAAETTGAWQIHLLAGATSEAAAATLTGLLTTAIDLSRHGYTLTPGPAVSSPDHAIADTHASTLAGTPALAELCIPPAAEIPGVAVHIRSTFAVTPPPVEKGMALGRVLDRSEHPAGQLLLSPDSLVRHTFVTGATGSGKTTTIQTLLAQATQTGLPWLVIEPAKAEYRHRLDAAVLRIGHPDSPAIGINPLQPAERFPLRTHADMVKALLVATFHAQEPFPQILSTAIDACYRDTGWDLALGAPARRFHTPRWPTLTDLITAARRTITAAGYGPEVEANVTGFVTVRLGSLTTGTAASFLTARAQLDMDKVLRANTILELEDIGDDTDKAIVMGAFLLRLTQQLRAHLNHAPGVLRHLTVIEEAHRLLRRQDQPGPAASAVETFADMLAEIRAYGEGLVIADQIPARLTADVIKNTAVKIIHRLPGADDREAVGAAINLTTDQSARLPALNPGQAAVATDGMRQPTLTTITPPALTTATRTSRIAGAEAVPTVGQLAHARALAAGQPLLGLWTDFTVLSHLLAMPHPKPKPAFAEWLATQDRDQLLLAVEDLAYAAVHARTTAIGTELGPTGLAEHVIADITAEITSRTGCEDLPYQWWLHPFRYNPARCELNDAILDEPVAGRHRQTAAWEALYGHPIPGDTAAQQRRHLENLAAEAETAIADMDKLLYGEPRTLGVHLSHPHADPRFASALSASLRQLLIPGGWAYSYYGLPVP